MNSSYPSQPRQKFPVFFVMGVCLCMYFSFHLLFGERGYLKLVHLEHAYDVTRIEADALVSSRESLEKKVVAMRSGSIDPDLFEERAQVMLGMFPENSIIIKN